MKPVASTDAKLRQYLLGTVVAILISMSGCVAKDIYARVNTLEDENSERKVHEAVIEKDVKDFRQSFEDFKKDVKDDIQRHHK